MLIIGRNPVIEALRYNNSSINKIVVLDNVYDVKIKEIISRAKSNNIIIEKVSKEIFSRYFDKKNKSEGISQGIFADVSDYLYAEFQSSIDELKENETATIVLLDEIQDPHNLGAIIRTCSACGIELVVLTEKNTAKINHTVIKSASGATNFIKISQIKSIYDTIDKLKNSGFDVIGTSLNAKKTHFDYLFKNKTVIVFGNEGTGLRKNVLKRCDNTLKIPIIGKKIDSLNVSVSAGVILYERLRQKSFSKA